MIVRTVQVQVQRRKYVLFRREGVLVGPAQHHLRVIDNVLEKPLNHYQPVFEATDKSRTATYQAEYKSSNAGVRYPRNSI